MKLLLKIIGVFLASILLVVILLFIFDYDYILRAVQVVYFQGHKTAYIDDYPEFQNRIIKADSSVISSWPLHENYNEAKPTDPLTDLNKELGTVAFLIIKNDSIWYEDYAEDYGMISKTNSFSMAKSITVALLGKAIKDGYIVDLNQPVGDFFPEFNKGEQAKLTVGDLASMSSGLDWDEDYFNPFSQTARAYFGEDIRKEALGLKVIEEPGTSFKYLSGNTILLGMVIEKATGKPLTTYLSERFWKPLGMAHDALWQLDSEESGMEKAYCCIASNARDFARFGKLLKDEGKWNAKQILDSEFVKTVTKARFEESPEYGYGFWLSDHNGKEIFYMRGVLGQYVIVIPEDDLIIVRLGHSLIQKEEDEKHAKDFFIYIDEAYKMLANDSKTTT
jgi:CubicO group peptidase (beta-lactamase class C family)